MELRQLKIPNWIIISSLVIILISTIIMTVMTVLCNKEETVNLNNYKTVSQLDVVLPIPPVVSEPNQIDKTKRYAFNIDNKLVVLNRNQLYAIIFEYIKSNIANERKNDYVYINKLTNCYIDLMSKEDNDTILRFIGLCKIESNFNNKSTSCVGASGIGQVMLSVWCGVMKNNWGITLDQYKNDINKQIITAYKIYQVYLKKNKGNLIKAHNGYSGGSNGYHKKVINQFVILKNNIKKKVG